jgi:2-C-methyl-D-erythritol 4-phosphate cytidylyltransferase
MNKIVINIWLSEWSMNTALIMAGGSGSRMLANDKKQFLLLNGRPLIAYTLDNFDSIREIEDIIVVAPQAELTRMDLLCRQEFPSREIKVIAGGSTRQQSVSNGLNACSSQTEIVLIHDGVRPFAKKELIIKLINIAREKKAVIPVSPVRNTIKRIKEDQITATVPRQQLFCAHTPQVFDYQLIKKYHRLALELTVSFTDDSSILEHFGIPVHVWITDDSNIKITQPHDLKIAGMLLKK